MFTNLIAEKRTWQWLLALMAALFLLQAAALIVLAAPPNVWTGASFSDCHGIDDQAGDAVISPGGATIPKCQVYGYYDDNNWDLYESLDYGGDGATTTDIENVTIGANDVWLFLEWDHVANWDSDKATGHGHYAEIDTDGDNRGDYYVGWQAKADLEADTAWLSAAENSLLIAEFKDSDSGANSVGGSDVMMSNLSSGSKGDGYDTDHFAGNDDIYARRTDTNNIQLAIKWSYLEVSSAPPSSVCVKMWSAQSSTLSESTLYWHDHFSSTDLSGNYYDNTQMNCLTPDAVKLSGINGSSPPPQMGWLIIVLVFAALFSFGLLATVKRHSE